MLCAGGFNWQYCIIPLILMGIYLALNFKRINGTLGIASLALLILLTASVVSTKGDPKSAVYESEKLLCFISALLIGSTTDKKSICGIYGLCMTFLAAIGLFAYCFHLNFADLILDDRYFLRLQSSVQYANTTACLLACGYFFSIDTVLRVNTSLKRCISQMILLSLYLTFSKACIPIFIAVCVLLVLKRINCRLIIVRQNIIAMLFFIPIAICVKYNICLLAGMLAIACILLGGYADNHEWDLSKLWLVFLACALIVSLTIAIKYPVVFDSLHQRMAFMKDAWGATKKYPWGFGSGSWEVLQYKFQTASYSVGLIHNGWLQILFDNGVIFLAAITTLTVFTMYTLRKRKDHLMFSVISIISLHSFVDFDFSFPIVLMIFGMIIGSTLDIDSGKGIVHIGRLCSFVFLAALAITSIHMSREYILRNSLERNYMRNDLWEAEQRGIILEKLCPYDAKLQISIGMMEFLQNEDTAALRERLRKAVSISPNDPSVYKYYMKYSLDTDNVYDMCCHYIDLCPMQEGTMEYINDYTKEAYNKGIITAKEREDILKKLNSH